MEGVARMEIDMKLIGDLASVDQAVNQSIEEGLAMLRAELERAPGEVRAIATHVRAVVGEIRHFCPDATFGYFYAPEPYPDAERHNLNVVVPGDKNERLRVVDACRVALSHSKDLGLSINVDCSEPEPVGTAA
jgi:pyridoxal biosynthesis lyase PdxS